MIFQLNNEVVLLKTEINLLKGDSLQEIMTKGNELNEKLHKRWIMIAGEGIVFITILLAGIYQIRKTFKKEEKLSQQQHNFLLSVTHELKSPIASAKLQLQTIQKHELSREQQNIIVTNAINDTDRLNTLVENILIASKIENGAIILEKELINISKYIHDVVSNMQQTFRFNRNLVLNICPDIHLSIDKTGFASIVMNLFENAVKYSPDKSSITVSLEKKKSDIVFSVADQGVGIDKQEKGNIFKKFYRVGSEDTRNAKGTGLGLYIVKNLVEQHGGIILVKDNVPNGCIFEVTFKAVS
jgi:two-component system, OmpR family, phosphate regulon sensor histidine kinase PhoR